MTKVYQKVTVDSSVLDLALDRLRVCFERHDTVVVAFSGGKDSTACLNLALRVAGELGRLPLDVMHYDEEAIPPETVEYVVRVAALPSVRLKWLCVPVKHRNACSRRQPWWYPWAPEDRHLWVRDLPPSSLTEADVPGFRRDAIPNLNGVMYGPEHGRVCVVNGIRAEESLNRYRSVAQRLDDAWLAPDGVAPHVTRAAPIYDWTTEDIWLAPDLFGWDHNRSYDVMQLAGLTLKDQRVAPPFGEQPIRGLWLFKQCWPELWARMCRRVPGAATAARYACTELYGFGSLEEVRPDDQRWRELTYDALAKLNADHRQKVAAGITEALRDHRRWTDDPVPDEEPHPVSGHSWKQISRIATRVDLKGRRITGNVKNRAISFRRARGYVDPARDRPDSRAD